MSISRFQSRVPFQYISDTHIMKEKQRIQGNGQNSIKFKRCSFSGNIPQARHNLNVHRYSKNSLKMQMIRGKAVKRTEQNFPTLITTTDLLAWTVSVFISS